MKSHRASANELILWFAVASILLLLVPFGQVRAALGADYHGQVVDADTGKPIEGAVVLAQVRHVK